MDWFLANNNCFNNVFSPLISLFYLYAHSAIIEEMRKPLQQLIFAVVGRVVNQSHTEPRHIRKRCHAQKELTTPPVAFRSVVQRASCKILRPPPAINANDSQRRIVEPEHTRAGSGMCGLQATGTSITRFCAKQPVAPHRRPALPRLWDAGRTRSQTAGIGLR